jgi:hypothetical protein
MASRIGNQVQSIVIGVVAAVVFLLVGVALGPTVASAAADINATSMENVTMGSVLVLLADYIPFFYYLGIVLGAIAMIWVTVNRKR